MGITPQQPDRQGLSPGDSKGDAPAAGDPHHHAKSSVEPLLIGPTAPPKAIAITPEGETILEPRGVSLSTDRTVATPVEGVKTAERADSIHLEQRSIGASLHHAAIASPGATISLGYSFVCLSRGEWLAAILSAAAGAVSIWNRFRDSYFGTTLPGNKATSSSERPGFLSRAYCYLRERIRRPALDLEMGAAYCLFAAGQAGLGKGWIYAVPYLVCFVGELSSAALTTRIHRSGIGREGTETNSPSRGPSFGAIGRIAQNPAIWFAAANVGFNLLTGGAKAIAAGGVQGCLYGLGLCCAVGASVYGIYEGLKKTGSPSGKSFWLHSFGSALFGAWNIAIGNVVSGVGYLLWFRSGRQQAMFLDKQRGGEAARKPPHE